MAKISVRGFEMVASPIRKLVPYANDAKARGVHVYHLNIGQPDIPTPPAIFDAMREYTERESVLPYGPSDGLPELRQAIAEYFGRYGIKLSADEVFITTGGSEAIVFAMLAVTDVGDEIIVFEPFYTNYKGFAMMAGIKLVPVTLSVETGFHLPDKAAIESKITEKTKAILICNPNNPTGTVYTREEVEMVAEIAKEHDLFVLSDEVYREFTFDGKEHTSILSIKDIEDKAVVLDSISKRFSACGARVGFIATHNRQVLETVLKFGQARLCPPTVAQVGAIAGFKTIDDFIKPMMDEYRRRRDTVFDELSKIPNIVAQKPEGAFYTVVRLPVEDAEDFAIFMLKDFQVDGKTTMVAPAADFYATPGLGKNEVRIAYVLKEEELRDAIRILGEGLKAYAER